MEDSFEKAFSNYFGKESTDDRVNMIAKSTDTSYTYSNEKVSNSRDIGDNKFVTGSYQLTADDNIDTISQLAEILKQLLNAAWGTEWGEISPDLKKGEDSAKVKLPQITLDINNREVAEKMPLKPVLMQTVKEEVNGQLTGDSILIYRQWFDCVVEFDFYARTSKEVRELLAKFESLISIYTGYLKRKGVSELMFLKETSARTSLNFIEQAPMKCLMYYVRFERITPIRQSLINKINASVGIQALSDEKIKTVIEANQKASVIKEVPAEIEFDFFGQDTGVEYKDI